MEDIINFQLKHSPRNVVELVGGVMIFCNPEDHCGLSSPKESSRVARTLPHPYQGPSGYKSVSEGSWGDRTGSNRTGVYLVRSGLCIQENAYA